MRVVGPAVAIALATAAAGCGGAPDPHDAMAEELMGAYEPLATCVTTALATRDDFDGNLGVFVVNRGLDEQLQTTAKRYLGTGVDVAALSHPERVAQAERTMKALARYTGEPAVGADRVRRAMALVEAMSIGAFATGVDCAPSDALAQAMTRAEQAYLTADRAAPKP